MADNTPRPPQTSSTSSDAWTGLITTAIVVGLPMFIGWLAQNQENAEQTKAQSDTKIINGEQVPANHPYSKFIYRDITSESRSKKNTRIQWRSQEIQQIGRKFLPPDLKSILLVGKIGVGKTALVKGVAQDIIEGKLPNLKGYDILEIRPNVFLEGARSRNSASPQERVQELVNSLSKSKTILFFDDFEQWLDENDLFLREVFSAIRQALLDNKILCVSAITPEGYERNIKSDVILLRSFDCIWLEKKSKTDEPFGELSVERTFLILQDYVKNYDSKYGIKISNETLKAVIQLVEQHLPDECLPGKAIDILDETVRQLRPHKESSEPLEIIALKEKIEELEKIQAQQIDKKAISGFQTQIDDLKKQLNGINNDWSKLKSAIERSISLLQNLEHAELAVKDGEKNLDRGTVERYRTYMEKLKAQASQENEILRPLQAKFRYAKDEINIQDIADILSLRIKRPVRPPTQDDKLKLLELEKYLHERVIGQDEAVRAVANVVRRMYAKSGTSVRPLGTFMFLGPTGVGKTELAKALSDIAFHGNLITIEMQNYISEHGMYQLLGAPPSYVGYDKTGGWLAKELENKPHSVVLFDEVEKAHPRIFDALLKILDEGSFTDSTGKKGDFTHTIIIFTSNLISTTPEDTTEFGIKNLLKASNKFRPEFINRVDEYIFFKPLTIEQMRQILEIFLRPICEGYCVKIIITDNAKDYLIEQGFSSEFGAREMRRSLQKLIESPLSERKIRGDFQDGNTILIDLADGNLQFTLQSEE